MEWKKIKNKLNYSVSDNGEIRNDKTGRILKLHKSTSGYYQVMLGRKTSPLYVHRIVAQAFIDNYDDLPQVDHINGNKLDNRVENLRWVTVSDNYYGFGCSKRIENKKKKIKAVNGEHIIIFNSRNECAEYFGVSKTRIRYNHMFQKGNMKNWIFELVKDIV